MSALPMVRVRTLVTALVAVWLSGCASFSKDGGFGQVQQLTRERMGAAPVWPRTEQEEHTVRARVEELLAAPLSAESAVELALINNPGLRASYYGLGIAEADLVQAGRLRNPVFSYVNIRSSDVQSIERSIAFDLLSLITMPYARQVEQRRFEQRQLEVAQEAAATAVQARRAFYEAVAARQLALYFEQVEETAELSRDLAQRMVEAGNAPRLAHMREQAFYAEVTAQLARTRHRAVAAREHLTRMLGLTSTQGVLQLPERLPDLPASPAEARDAEQTAMDRRLDVLAAKRANEAYARSLGLTRTTRFVNVLEAGYVNESESREERKDGYEIHLSIPIFDFGDARVARAKASYMQSVARTADTAVKARSQVREAYSAYRTAFDLARHYRDEVVPLRKRISEETLLRYNGMLVGPFELLADAREQVTAVNAALEAQRDFWLADTDLRTTLTIGTPGGSTLTTLVATPGPAAAAGGGH